MDIIISNASGKPIYDQIVSQIKEAILTGELSEGDLLPSIRSLANDLHISVITTKRAYAELEASGFIDTVQGKGSFVAGKNLDYLREERIRRVEDLAARLVSDAASAGISIDEVHDMIDIFARGD